MKNFNKGNNEKHKLAEVVSIVSHQLKTPLSVIKGYLEVLNSEDLGKLNKAQEEYVRDALENTERMNDLVKDLLDVSRIEEDRLELKNKLSNLSKIVKETIKDIQPLAEASNCTIVFLVSEKIPSMYLDPIKIRQVISNFIVNAIKYNKKKGKVEIFLKKKGNSMLFGCKDTGIGITGREKKNIFKKFYRSENAFIANTVGSGLGLFISKAIIEQSGGKIWFKSKKDKGTVFYFSLPIKITKK